MKNFCPLLFAFWLAAVVFSPAPLAAEDGIVEKPHRSAFGSLFEENDFVFLGQVHHPDSEQAQLAQSDAENDPSNPFNRPADEDPYQFIPDKDNVFKNLGYTYGKFKTASKVVSKTYTSENIVLIFDSPEEVTTDSGRIQILVNSFEPLIKVIVNEEEIEITNPYLIETWVDFNIPEGLDTFSVFAFSANDSIKAKYRVRLAEEDSAAEGVNALNMYIGANYQVSENHSPNSPVEEDEKTTGETIGLNFGFAYNILEKKEVYIPDKLGGLLSYFQNTEANSTNRRITNYLAEIYAEKYFFENFNTTFSFSTEQKKTKRDNAPVFNEKNNVIGFTADYKLIRNDDVFYRFEYIFQSTNYENDDPNSLDLNDPSGLTYGLEAGYSRTMKQTHKLVFNAAYSTFLTEGEYQKRNETEVDLGYTKTIGAFKLGYSLSSKNENYTETNLSFGLKPSNKKISHSLKADYLFHTSLLGLSLKHTDDDWNIDIRDRTSSSVSVSYLYIF